MNAVGIVCRNHAVSIHPKIRAKSLCIQTGGKGRRGGILDVHDLDAVVAVGYIGIVTLNVDLIGRLVARLRILISQWKRRNRRWINIFYVRYGESAYFTGRQEVVSIFFNGINLISHVDLLNDLCIGWLRDKDHAQPLIRRGDIGHLVGYDGL